MFCICYWYYLGRIHTWKHAHWCCLQVPHQFHMNLSLQEVDHILAALETMSSYDIARAREQVINGVSDHPELIQKLKDYRLRLT